MKQIFTFLTLLFILGYSYTLKAQACGGDIFEGSEGVGSFLDKDGDGDIVHPGTGFTDCATTVDEITQFEDLRTGCSCEIPWTPLGSLIEIDHDLIAGGTGCGDTDLVTQTDDIADTNYAYYTIIDKDGNCNSDDKLIVVRFRADSEVSGNFSFSLLIDTKDGFGSNAPEMVVCSNTGAKLINPGFEFEVVASPGTGKKVSVYNIDNQVGSGTLVVEYDNTVYYNQAEACRSECACRTNGNQNFATYHTFAFALTDINKSCNDFNFTMIGATAASGNGTIISNTSAKDIGGQGNLPINDTGENCNCFSRCFIGSTDPLYTCNTDFDQCRIACLQECLAEATGPLPVELMDFLGHPVNEHVQLQWVTTSELNNAYFEIQRSEDGRIFQNIGMVEGQGTIETTNKYAFIDKYALPFAYYRLKQVDFDGKFKFSQIINVKRGDLESKLMVYPTEAFNEITLRLESLDSRKSYLKIANASGQLMYEETYYSTADTEYLDLDVQSYPPGIYFVSLSNKVETVTSKFVVVTD